MPPVLVDRNRLEMAILNLAVNARDAMDGSGNLSFRVDPLPDGDTRELGPGDYIAIAVMDTGLQMNVRALGRTVVHGLAMQSGGASRKESVPGGGRAQPLF